MQQKNDSPVGLQAVVKNALRALSVPALSSTTLSKIKNYLLKISGYATKQQVAEAIELIQPQKKSIQDPKTRAIVQEFVVNPLLGTIGRTPQPVQEDKEIGREQIRNLSDQQKAEEDSIRGLKKYSPKQKPGGINNRGLVYAALDNIIIKLASLSQPLGVRPDYGSTGDISERIKKIKEQLKTAVCEATMLKMVPPMGENQEESSQCPCIEDYDEEPEQTPTESPCIQDYDEETAQPSAEGPKVIVIKVDDEPADKAQVVKEGPPCCNECGQPIPAQMGREAHCMEHKFKAIKEMLGKKEIGEAQIKSIRKNLDDIYSKYRALEKETGDD